MEDWENAAHWGQKALAADPENQRHRELLKEATAKMKK
jgi:hypothetical protein